MNICLTEWQQCMVRLMNYTVLCMLSEILRFLDSFCLLLIIMAVETVLVHAEGRMDDHDNDVSVYLCANVGLYLSVYR